MKNIAYLYLVLLSLKSTAQPLIYPYSDGHRWGLTNANLEVIAKPQFDTTVFFGKESYGIAVKDKKYGTIGRDGKTQIDFTYAKINTFREEFGRGYSNGKFVLLNLKTGKVVSPEVLDEIWDYCNCNDKIFTVKKGEQTIFFSGITGKQVGKTAYQDVAEFLPEQQGAGTKAIVKTNGKSGVLDPKTGAWIIPAKYDEVRQTYHQDQIAIVAMANGVKSYFDYNGKPIQEKPKAGGMEEEGVGLAVVEAPVDQEWTSKDLYVYNQGGGNWKLGIETRSSGNTKVHQTYEVKGYADVEKISYYDEQNKVPALIKAVKEGKTGIIGLKGEVLVPFIYDNIEELKNHSHYLQTTLNNKTGVLRRNLTELSKPVLKQVLAEEYRLKAWYVEMPNGYRGYMDTETGKIFIPGAE